MRAVVQRVNRASVSSGGEIKGAIGKGLLVFLGVEKEDGEEDLCYVARKIAGLRVFSDERGLLNLDAKDVGGEILLISQFTLSGDARKGRRPSYDRAATPDEARALYEKCLILLNAEGIRTEGGAFRQHMEIECIHDGPVTILLDSRKTF